MKKFFLLCFLCLVFSSVKGQAFLGWTTQSVNLRKGPNTSDQIISTLNQGTQIFISSLNPQNGFVKIIDIATNEEGFVSKAFIKVGEEVAISSQGLLQQTGKVGSYEPEIEIYNNTDRSLTLKMNEQYFIFLSKERKKFTLPPGTYSYRASAPGVIPDLGTEKLLNNNGYSWEFYISTR